MSLEDKAGLLLPLPGEMGREGSSQHRTVRTRHLASLKPQTLQTPQNMELCLLEPQFLLITIITMTTTIIL